jgi:AAHS family 4-hydroxybenzoate transporter-like MFS transporter
VEQLLHRPFGAYRTMVFALCGLIMIIEGFDMYMVGNIVPTLAQAFRTEPAMIALIFSAQGVGLALGYAIVSPLADRFGRRPTVLACILMFSLLTLAAAAADSVGQLAMLRLAAFIFFGGVIPNVIALVTEISSFGQRQRVVVLLSALYAIGAATAGFIAPALAERFGWSGIFLLGGAIPLIILPLLFLVLPESPRFLVLKDPAGDRARRVIGKVVGEPFPAGATFRLSEPVTGKLPAAALFAPERRRTTFLIAGMSAMSVLVLNMVAAWLPTYLHIYGGFPMVTAARIVASSVIGAILLPILLSLLIQRVGASLAVAVCWVILFGAFVVGAQGGINAIASSAYPTEMRATGIGWTAGFGRLVAIAGPAIGGILLAMQFSQLAIAIVFAAPMLIVAAAALALPRQRGE